MTGNEFAAKCHDTPNMGKPYSKLDCQAFVEAELSRAGIDKHNYRGSNDMWRNMVKNRSDNMQTILPGELVFTIKNDGGERERGYNDNMGNASHIGIYLGDGLVHHSTTGGVQKDNVTSKRWTHHAQHKNIVYNESGNPYKEALLQIDGILKGVLNT